MEARCDGARDAWGALRQLGEDGLGNGLDLLGEIEERFPDLLVMMVTAYGDEECRRTTELGAAVFLTKQVDFNLLKTSAIAPCCRLRSASLGRMAAYRTSQSILAARGKV